MSHVEFEVGFNSAHRLSTDGVGKCGRIHGHNYHLHVSFDGELDQHGFVTDYGWVKGFLGRYDHRLILWEGDPLVEELGGADGPRADWLVLLPCQPTTEHFARHLAEQFYRTALGAVRVVGVRLCETDNIAATAVVTSADLIAPDAHTAFLGQLSFEDVASSRTRYECQRCLVDRGEAHEVGPGDYPADFKGKKFAQLCQRCFDEVFASLTRPAVG